MDLKERMQEYLSRERETLFIKVFMRRRSKIDLVVHDDDIHTAPGLRDVAEILFGESAQQRLGEYFADKPTIT